MTNGPFKVAVIGAGPAGLTAAYLLAKKSASCVVIEAHPTLVGGISRTASYKDFLFDIGGHRFFSKSQAVEDLWTELLPNDMLERPRKSRIYYRRHFFSYPLRPFETLGKLGLWESTLCVLSYLKARIWPYKNPRSYEEWVVNQFGERLFRIFFKTYTEKVWGMNCKDISADWAAQRIQGLSLFSAVINSLKLNRGNKVKTLIHSFRYPRKGPGMLWDACAKKFKDRGGILRMGQQVTALCFDEGRGLWTLTCKDENGTEKIIEAEHVLSSAPLRELCQSLTPKPSPQALAAASALKYRDFLIVSLVMKDRNHLDDNWIYIHEPGVKVGRVQNFKAWSPEMVPNPELCCYGLEYFCFEGDGLWAQSDAQLIELAKSELVKIGLAAGEDYLDGCVVRQKKAYPVYDDTYANNVDIIRQDLEAKFPTLHLAGRNGMHKYNNQDHAMMTAMLSVENILAGERKFDVWQVNQDAEYHESGPSGGAGGLRQVPVSLKN